jgi:hypothetical protein
VTRSHWFEVIEKELRRPDIVPGNVYNMDETGIMLSMQSSTKVLVGKDDRRDYRGAEVKRKMVTAIVCISASGESLNPIIIWPAKSHRSNWTTCPTPGWHYAYSETRYNNSKISLEWIKHVFDPQTKARANQKPRLLISDGFGSHETLEILEFCFENNILLYRLPSHTSHKLQPLDVAVFGPLKAAYRDQVDRLERGGVDTVRKEHFTTLYSPARERAITKKNILAGFAKTGLYPFNPDRVLTKPVPALTTSKACEVDVGPCTQGEVVQTPVTPVTSKALMSLLNMIKQVPDDETSRQHKDRLQQKVAHAAETFCAERALQQDHIQFLCKMNNEAKVRRSTKSVVLGKAKVMSYEDIEEARTKRAEEQAAKKAAQAAKEAKKAAKESAKATKQAAKEEATASRGKGSRKRKNFAEEDASEPKAKVARKRKSAALEADMPQPKAKVARMSDAQIAGPGAPEPKAPVAWMSEAQAVEDEVL